MLLKFIMRYLANNEHLIEQLAQSKVMRRGAQWTVFSILKWRKLGNEVLKSPAVRSVEESSDHFTSKLQLFSRRLTGELKTGVKEFQDEMKSRRKR